MERGFTISRRRLMASGIALAALGGTALAAPAKKLKIAFIGAGRIGGELAELWAKAGYQVMISARNLDEVQKLAAKIGMGVTAGTTEQAASFGDVVVVSVPYGAIRQIARDYGAQLKGKIILDTCNPKDKDYLTLTPEEKALGTGVIDQRIFYGTRLVKAFNTVYSSVLLTATGKKVGVPLAADDKKALAVARQLVIDAGYEPVIAGNLKSAKIFDAYTPFHTTGMSAADVRKNLKEKPAPVFTN